MKKIGIKLADGTFHPLLEEGVPDKKKVTLSTIKDNQTTVQVDLYASEKSTMADAILICSLVLNGLQKQPNGQPDIILSASIDKKNIIEASLAESKGKARAGDKVDLREVLLASDKNPGTGKGLLAAAQEINDRDDSEEKRLANELDGFALSSSFDEGPAPQAETVVIKSRASSKAAQTEKAAPIPETEPQEEAQDGGLGGLDDFSLPETESGALEDGAASAQEEAVEEPADQSLDLPDFDEPTFGQDSSRSAPDDFSGGALLDESPSDEPLKFDDSEFDLPDFSDSSSDSGPLDGFDDSFGESSSSGESAQGQSSSDLDFSDLYDEEEDASEEKKSRLPLLLCVICAIICVLAVLLLLFILPSRLNSRSEKTVAAYENAATTVPPVQKEEPLPPPPPPKPEPLPEPAAPAKEEEIVVIQQAEMVIPDLPRIEEKKEPKVISYKVKWGDTLWDIADAYYKNPWRYPKIAQYNGIKNPNHIVAGTYIKIPEE